MDSGQTEQYLDLHGLKLYNRIVEGKIAEAIGSASTFNVEVVDVLPETGETHTIYFVPAEVSGETNVHDEYIWVEDRWELIGSTQVDFSEYYTKTDINAKLLDYYTTGETVELLNGKQDVISDLDEIRSGATLGLSALQTVPEEYITDSALTEALSDYYTTGETDEMIEHITYVMSNHIIALNKRVDEKQNILIAGEGIEISGDTISCTVTGGTGGSYTAGDGIDISGNVISVVGKQDELIAGEGIEISGNTISCIGGIDSLIVDIEYNDLVTLCAESGLTPGMHYKIIDYVTIINKELDYVSSEEYPFDVIVLADSVNSLNESAFAYNGGRSEGYFDNSDLSAWELKYTLYNDDPRFNWGNGQTGKGIIYYMKDEFGNEAPYDFKNIVQRDSEFTFGNEEEDYTLDGFANGVFNNKILPYIDPVTHKQGINKLRISKTNCFGNIIKTSCYDSYIGFTISECDISMNELGQLVVFKTVDFISGIENHAIPKGLRKEPLTFEALSGDTQIILKLYNPQPYSYITYPESRTVEVSTDKETWEEMTCSYDDNTIILGTISAGEKLYVRGNNLTYSGEFSGTTDGSTVSTFPYYYHFDADDYVNVSGNIMAIVQKHDYIHLNVVADNAFKQLFFQNDNIVSAEELMLPATTLGKYCYESMFYECSNLTSIPEMLADTLSEGCYLDMFGGCTSLMNLPTLHATTLAPYCYSAMFNGCTSLTTIPEGMLPATALTQGCYSDMFNGCTSLTTVPSDLLPATALTYECYFEMFLGCTSLETIPSGLLPATHLATYCYRSMFQDCTNLETVPQDLLPATTLANSCYLSMFQSCESLLTSPALPAENLVHYCYENMFNGCTNLSYIRCYAISGMSQNDSTTDWVAGVNATGTFERYFVSYGWQPDDPNGIPQGWTVTDYNPYLSQYFTCEMLSTGYFTVASMREQAGVYTSTMDYKLNDDGTWSTITVDNTGWTIEVTTGDKLYFRGTNNAYAFGDNKHYIIFGYNGTNASYQNTVKQPTTVYFNVYGNSMSLLYGDNFADKTVLTSAFTFCSIFKTSNVISAEYLMFPATTLLPSCYRAMFSKSIYVTTSPMLFAKDLVDQCYKYMFETCSALTKVVCLAETGIDTGSSVNAFMTGTVTGTSAANCKFIKSPNATVGGTGTSNWVRGVNGIQTGWQVEDAVIYNT